MGEEGRSAAEKFQPPELVLGWGVVLALVAVFAEHSLWSQCGQIVLFGPFFAMLTGWGPSSLRRMGAAMGFGTVLGLVVGSFIAVPPVLTFICMLGDQYRVATTFFVGMLALLLAGLLWLRDLRRDEGMDARAYLRSSAVVHLVAWLSLVLAGAWVSSREGPLGHAPRMLVMAEDLAREQLGPDYADYRFHERRLESTRRRGVSTTWRASLIAYSPELGDAFDVDVVWTEPWSE